MSESRHCWAFRHLMCLKTKHANVQIADIYCNVNILKLLKGIYSKCLKTGHPKSGLNVQNSHNYLLPFYHIKCCGQSCETDFRNPDVFVWFFTQLFENQVVRNPDIVGFWTLTVIFAVPSCQY